MEDKTKSEKVILGAQVIVAVYSAAVAVKGLGEMGVDIHKAIEKRRASQKLQTL